MKVLITLGPTREPIDEIRFITNASSGKMGSMLAKEAISRGYETTIVSGPVNISLPDKAKILPVRTAGEMIETSLNELRSSYDIFISTAAIADYSPEFREGKIKSGTRDIRIKLMPNPKLTRLARENFPNLFIVAFKAEYNVSADKLAESAHLKLKREDLNLVIANDIKKCGFGSDMIEVYLVNKEGRVTYMPLNSKDNIAEGVWDFINEERGNDEVK